MGRTFGYIGWIRIRSEWMGTLNRVPHVDRLQRSLLVKNPSPNSVIGLFIGPIACPYPIYPHFQVAVSIFPTIVQENLYCRTYLLLYFIVKLLSVETCMKYFPLDVKRKSINQSFNNFVKDDSILLFQTLMHKLVTFHLDNWLTVFAWHPVAS